MNRFGIQCTTETGRPEGDHTDQSTSTRCETLNAFHMTIKRKRVHIMEQMYDQDSMRQNYPPKNFLNLPLPSAQTNYPLFSEGCGIGSENFFMPTHPHPPHNFCSKSRILFGIFDFFCYHRLNSSAEYSISSQATAWVKM